MVADEMAEPVGPEFRKTFDEQNFGLPLKDALDNLTQRVPHIDVRFFATAVLIQRETGGNLVGDSREPGARRARALQDPAAGARLHRARAHDRLRAAGAARRALHRAVVHQPGSHESALPRAHGPDAADDRRCHAGHRLSSGSVRSSRSRCSVSMLLPFLAFVFGSLIVAAAALRSMPNRAGAIDRRLEELTAARDDADSGQQTFETLVSLVKRIGEKAPQDREGAGRAAPAAGAGRLPPPRGDDGLLRHPRSCWRWGCSCCSRRRSSCGRT